MGSIDINFVEEEDICLYSDDNRLTYYLHYKVIEAIEFDGKKYFCAHKTGFGHNENVSDKGYFKNVLCNQVYNIYSRSDFIYFTGKERTTFWGPTVVCNYCNRNAFGEVEISIRKISVYNRPPPGVRDLNVLLSPIFYAYRINRATAYCRKCGAKEESKSEIRIKFLF